MVQHKVNLPAGAGAIEVIAVRFDGIPGTADTFTPIIFAECQIKCRRKSKFQFS